MNKEAQRIAIAEACGWTEIKPQRATTGISDYPTGKLNGVRKDGSRDYYVPNYLKDLNAMHEAEKVLNEKQDHIMNDTLWDMCEGRKYLWHATASQRAEAFLRTIGKWEESNP